MLGLSKSRERWFWIIALTLATSLSFSGFSGAEVPPAVPDGPVGAGDDGPTGGGDGGDPDETGVYVVQPGPDNSPGDGNGRSDGRKTPGRSLARGDMGDGAWWTSILELWIRLR